MAFTGLESVSGLHVPRSDAPKRDWASEHRILLQEVRCRPPKFDSRFPAPLTQDGDAPGTQESRPSATPPTSTRNAWPCFGWWLVNTPSLGPVYLTAARRSSRAAWASLGEPPKWLGHLRHVPTAQEPELGILGAATATSLGRIATPQGACRPGPRGMGRGVLVRILGSLGWALYGSELGHVRLRRVFREGWYSANVVRKLFDAKAEEYTRTPRHAYMHTCIHTHIHTSSLSLYRGHLCTAPPPSPLLLLAPVHTSSLSLYRGTCAPPLS